jgi:hypothetical protein
MSTFTPGRIRHLGPMRAPMKRSAAMRAGLAAFGSHLTNGSTK